MPKPRKKRIAQLSDSIPIAESKDFDLDRLFGAWEDMRSSEEIINEIKKSRVENQPIKDL